MLSPYKTPQFRENGRINCYKRWPQWDSTVTDPIDRFWMRIDKKGSQECWPWKGSRSKTGYGRAWWGGKNRGPHTVMWELRHGPIPKGTFICHTCDNRICCNPHHLFEGNPKINIDDAVKKNRMAVGERNGFSKLTEQEVKEIRFRFSKGGITRKELAALYATDVSNIGLIVRRHTWKQII